MSRLSIDFKLTKALALFAFLLAGFEPARADNYPRQLIGVWGGRAQHQGDDNPAVASKACDSYRTNPKTVVGDILVFRGSEKFSYGSYADYVDKNISVTQIAPNKWLVSDRHYDDEESGRRAGYRRVTYTLLKLSNCHHQLSQGSWDKKEPRGMGVSRLSSRRSGERGQSDSRSVKNCNGLSNGSGHGENNERHSQRH